MHLKSIDIVGYKSFADKTHVDLEPSWLLSGHLPAVEARSIARVISRAASFPVEGRVPMPTQLVLEAALAGAGRAA